MSLLNATKKVESWSADLKIADLLGWPCQCLNSGPSQYLFAFYLASYQRNTWYLVSQLASWTTKTCRGHCLMPTIVLLLMMMMRIFLKPLKRTLMKGHQPTKITKWRSWLLKTSSLICKGLPCCQNMPNNNIPFWLLIDRWFLAIDIFEKKWDIKVAETKNVFRKILMWYLCFDEDICVVTIKINGYHLLFGTAC